MNTINILVLESDTQQYPQYEIFLTRIFNRLSLSPEIIFCQTPTEAKKAINGSFGGTRISMMFCDLTMGDRENRGLLWIKELKTVFPDLFVVGCTGSDIAHTSTSAIRPTFDLFLHKQMLSTPSDNDEFAVSNLKRLYKRNASIEIDRDSDINDEKNFKNGFKNRDLDSLMSQIFYHGYDVDELTNLNSVKLTPIFGGLSPSHIFKAELTNQQSQTKGVLCVIKVSEPEEAKREAANFSKYVKWNLPYEWRVELLGQGYTKKWGAICYAFAKSGLVSFDSATKFIAEGQKDRVEKILETIFSERYQTWYSSKLIKPASESLEVPLNQHYKEKFFPGQLLSKCSPVFKQMAQDLCGAKIIDDHSIEINCGQETVSIQNPVNRLFNIGDVNFLTSIAHGDLNSNNILISDDNSLTFIDFQNTERQHVFMDFVVFENSLRIYYPLEKISIMEMIRFENLISSEDALRGKDLSAEIPVIYQLILEVRKKAINNFPDEPFKNYIQGTTIFALRLLRASWLKDDQYRRCLTQIFSGVSILNNLLKNSK